MKEKVVNSAKKIGKKKNKKSSTQNNISYNCIVFNKSLYSIKINVYRRKFHSNS